MLDPFLGAYIASLTGSFLSGIATNLACEVIGGRLDHKLYNNWAQLRENLQSYRPDENHDLQRATYRAYLQATLQVCAMRGGQFDDAFDGWLDNQFLPAVLAKPRQWLQSTKNNLQLSSGDFDEVEWLKWVCQKVTQQICELDEEATRAELAKEIPELDGLLKEYELLLEPDGAAEREAQLRDALVKVALADFEDRYGRATGRYPTAELRDLFRQHWFKCLLANFQYSFKNDNQVAAMVTGKLLAGLSVRQPDGAQQLVTTEWAQAQLDALGGELTARVNEVCALLEAQDDKFNTIGREMLPPLLMLEHDTNTQVRLSQAWLASLLEKANDIAQGIGRIEQNVGQVGEGVDRVEQGVDELKQDLGKVGEEVDRVEQSVGKVEQGVDGLKQDVGRVEQGVDKVATGVGDLKEDFDKVADKIDEALSKLPHGSPHQLRAAVKGFVGREGQIKLLCEALQNGGSASISSINGMGGIGKTELAVVVANQLRDQYPDGQLMIDLRGTTEPLTPSQILENCIRPFVSLEAKLPDDEEALRRDYVSHLSGKRVLVVLDNAFDDKQVLPLQPPEGCALLVTSREKIALPDALHIKLDELPPDKAQELLLQIARRPTFDEEVANRICQMCGYLPLAIRAAGSLLMVTEDLTPAAYAEDLSDELTRLEKLGEYGVPHSVTASFNLSYAKLSDEAAKVFCKLAVFPASFIAEAAEVVCEDAGHRHLSDLLRRSLVLFNSETRRYRLHDLIRLFANRKLEADERYAAQKRHAEFYAQVLAKADDLYLAGNESILVGLRLFEDEWANIQAGQAWAAEHNATDNDAAELCIRYPDAGVYVLGLRQHPRERIDWLTTSVAAAKRLGQRSAEGNALGNLGNAYAALGETRRAIEFYEQYLSIAREIGDRRGEGADLGNLGNAYAALGETRRAIEFYEQYLSIAREIGDRRGEGNALGNLGLAYADLGETRRAIEFYEQQLDIVREIGDRRGEGNVLGNLGLAYRNLGEPRRAIEFHEQALVISREIGDRRGEGADLGGLALAYAALGETRRAIEFYEQALVISREIGDRRGEGADLGNLGNAYADLGETRRAIEFYEQRLVIAREIGDRRGEGNALFNSSLSLYKLGEHAEAISRAEAALAIYEQIESPAAATVRETLVEWRGEG